MRVSSKQTKEKYQYIKVCTILEQDEDNEDDDGF